MTALRSARIWARNSLAGSLAGSLVGSLGDELAGEGLFEDRLAGGFAALERGIDLPLVLRDHRELLVEESDNFLLLGEGTNGGRHRFDVSTWARSTGSSRHNVTRILYGYYPGASHTTTVLKIEWVTR